MSLDATFRPCDYRPVRVLQLFSAGHKLRSAVRDSHPPVFLRESSRIFRAPASGSLTVLCEFSHGEDPGRRFEGSAGFGHHRHHGKPGGGTGAGNGLGGGGAAAGSSSVACGGTTDHLGDSICSKGETKRLFGSGGRGPNLDSHSGVNWSRPIPDGTPRSGGFLHDCSFDYSNGFKDSRPAWACSPSWSTLEGCPSPAPNLHGSTQEYLSKKNIDRSSFDDRIVGHLNLHMSIDEQMSRKKMGQPSLDEIPRLSMSRIEQNLLKDKVGTADMPMSLRMLKKRAHRQSPGRDALSSSSNRLPALSDSTCCSFKKAFSSMFFMIRSVQNYTMHLRQSILYEDLQGVLAAVQREMHCSFLWLFQQVFACTPELMLSVMLLLANYTVHSMGDYVALDPTLIASASTDVRVVQTMSDFRGRQALETIFASSGAVQHEAPPSFTDVARLNEKSDSWANSQTDNGAGGSSKSVVSVSGGSEGPQYSRSPSLAASVFSNQDINATDVRKLGDDLHDEQPVLENLDKGSKDAARVPMMLDWGTMRALVAPVVAKLAPDDYPCYDRTELVYQHAICNDINNAMLLANYAQFLFLVRHDHDRAEQLFTKAVSSDPDDGDIIGRYASFLWLARGDRIAAEEAYRRVVNLNPTNPYFAALYAQFLWHIAAGEDLVKPLPPSAASSPPSSN